MSIFKKLAKFTGIGLATSLALKGLRLVLKPLLPKVPKLTSNTATEQVQDIRAQNNLAKPGEPQTVLYGRNTGYYPTLSAAQWFEYVNNEQILYLRMRVTVGIASMEQLRIGKTPISAFAGSNYQLCLPGERMTLFHPNVFTAEQLSGVELLAGVLRTRIYTGEIVFSGNRIRVPNDAASVAVRAAAGINPFTNVEIGDDVIVSGSAFNDGTYEAIGFDGSNPVDYIDVRNSDDSPVTFVDETAPIASIFYGTYFFDGSSAPRVREIPLVFSNALSEVTSGPLDGVARPLHRFLPGDLITFTLDAGDNRREPFTVIAQTDTGLVLSPPPTSYSGTASVWLLRRYFGPYPVCPPGDTVDRVAFDLLFPNGIGSNGGEREITIRFSPEYQLIDDAGTPTTGWISFERLSVTDARRNPQRRSYVYTLPTPARVQVRLARVNIDAEDGNILDTVQWVGARGYIVARPGEEPDIDVDSTTLNVALRNGNSVLIQGDETKVNGTFQRWLETYNETTGTWQPERPTRSVMWAALDKMRGRYTARGRQIPDDSIDLCGAINIGQLLDARGDTFDGQFSVAGNLRDNVNTILRLGRTELRYELRNYRFGFYRDQDTEPFQLFCDGLNAEVDTGPVRFRTSNDATGVQVSYWEPALNDEGIIGIGDTDAKPIKVDLRNGCSKRDQAWREANYEWNAERYRNQTLSITTELEPLVLDRGSRVLVASRRLGWGQVAQVVSVGGMTAREVTVWPPLDWSGSGYGVTFRDPQGIPGSRIACTRIADDVLLLADDLDVEITGDASGEQRTLLAFDAAGDTPRVAIVDKITWRDANGPGQTATIDCVLDDARVHAEPGPTPVDPFAPVIVSPRLDVSPLILTVTAGVVGASWTAVPAAVLYVLEWRYAGAPEWTVASRGVLATGVFPVVFPADIEVRVQAFGSGGESGPYATATLFVDEGTGGPAALTVTVSPSTLYRATTGPTAVTSAATTTIIGGTVPYTRLWVRISGDLRIVADSPTAGSTTFSASAIAAGETLTAIYRLQATDGAATVALSPAVTVTIQNTATGGTPGGPPPAAERTFYLTEDGEPLLTEDGDQYIAE